MASSSVFFPITVNLNDFFADYRSRCKVFINEKIKKISDLEQKIKKIFEISDFYLICDNSYLPSVEDVRVLKKDDVICVRRRYIPSVDEISSNNKKDDFNVQIKLVKKKKKIKFDSDVEEKEIKKKRKKRDRSDLEGTKVEDSNVFIPKKKAKNIFWTENSGTTTALKKIKNDSKKNKINVLQNMKFESDNNSIAEDKKCIKSDNLCSRVNIVKIIKIEDNNNKIYAVNTDLKSDKNTSIINENLPKETHEVKISEENNSKNQIVKTEEDYKIKDRKNGIAECSEKFATIQCTNEIIKEIKGDELASTSIISVDSDISNFSETFMFKSSTGSLLENAAEKNESQIENLSTRQNGKTKNRYSKLLLSGIGDTLNKLKSDTENKDNSDLFVTKRKRYRKRKKKSSTIISNNDCFKTEAISDSSDIKPSIHIKFEDNEIQVLEDHSKSNGYENSNEDNNIEKKPSTVEIVREISSEFNKAIGKDVVQESEKASHSIETENLSDSICKFLGTSTIEKQSMPIIDLTDVSVSVDAIMKCPLLEKSNFPRKDEIISFKILKLTDFYTPEVSNYVTGKILEADKEKQEITVYLIDGVDELTIPKGKFSIDEEEADVDNIVKLSWSDLIEPRLLFP